MKQQEEDEEEEDEYDIFSDDDGDPENTRNVWYSHSIRRNMDTRMNLFGKEVIIRLTCLWLAL